MAKNDASLPIDPNVKVPGNVAAQAARAEAIHKEAYKPQPDPAAPQPQPQPDPAAVTAPVTGDPAREQVPPFAPAAAPQAPAREQSRPADSGEPGSWEHRYHSMKGRYDQQSLTVGQMQEQMAQMGDEMLRLQASFQGRQPPLPTPQDQPPAHVRLTQEDVKTFGPDLIDFIQRAALDAVAPELGRTVQEVKKTQQRVQHTANLTVYQVLDQQVPDWRVINMDAAFKTWCSLPDVYSGMLRGNLLKAAFQAADAPRVIAFFKGYKAEQQATGQLPAPTGQQQLAQPVPAAPAVTLESLVAPGRAKPAPGDSAVSAADKPIFSRADIQRFYALVRQGYYAGRDNDKARDEQAIFLAQREGRVRG